MTAADAEQKKRVGIRMASDPLKLASVENSCLLSGQSEFIVDTGNCVTIELQPLSKIAQVLCFFRRVDFDRHYGHCLDRGSQGCRYGSCEASDVQWCVEFGIYEIDFCLIDIITQSANDVLLLILINVSVGLGGIAHCSD